MGLHRAFACELKNLTPFVAASESHPLHTCEIPISLHRPTLPNETRSPQIQALTWRPKDLTSSCFEEAWYTWMSSGGGDMKCMSAASTGFEQAPCVCARRSVSTASKGPRLRGGAAPASALEPLSVSVELRGNEGESWLLLPPPPRLAASFCASCDASTGACLVALVSRAGASWWVLC